MSEFNFKGIIKDLQQKHNGDKYFQRPHTTITFAMTPIMNQKIFQQIIDEIVTKGHFATVGIQTKEQKIEHRT